MTFNQLKIFETVAKHSNLSRAADEMRISQPSISKQLRALQDDYGIRLYIRSVHGVRLTTFGHQFRDIARPILQQIQELEDFITSKSVKSSPKSLKIAAAESPSVSLIPKLFKAFKESHPRVQLFLRTGDGQALEQLVTNGETELAISTSPSMNSQLTSEPFFSAEVVAVVSAKNPLGKKKNISVQELAGTPVVTKVGRRISTQLQQQLGIKLNIVLECESMEALKAAVQSDIGMGFLYRGTVEADLWNRNLREVNVPALKQSEIKWYVLFRKTKILSPNAKDFLSILRQRFQPFSHDE